MVVSDVAVWLDSTIDSELMRDIKAYVAANIGVPLVTHPKESIDGVAYECCTRSAPSMLTDEMYQGDFKPFADSLMAACNAAGIKALKDIRFMRLQCGYAVAVRGIWI